MRFLQSVSWLLLTTLAAARGVTPSPTDGLEPISILISKTSIFQASARPTEASGNPCAIVSEQIKAVIAASPSATPVRLPAEIGYNCLQSVPIIEDDAITLVESFKPFIQFQSTLEYLIDPPAGYLMPAIDLLGGLDDIEKKIRRNKYSGEYDFQIELFELFQRAHDGHLGFIGDVLGNGLVFFRTFNLVSVSEDGQQLPKVYVDSDVVPGLNFTPSAVISIEGRDAILYLKAWSLKNNLQDPDALYNTLFSEIAQSAIANLPLFSTATQFPGPNTTITFENGTSQTLPNEAIVAGDFTGVDSGTAFYKKFCTPSTASESAAASSIAAASTSSAPPAPTIPGYPNPIIKHSKNAVSGYFLRSPAYRDYAVLSILTFEVSGEEAQEFQDVVQKFLEKTTKDRKKKLIVDLQANGGGTILAGYDLFGQLFPHIEPYGAGNLRAHADLNIIGQGFSDFIGTIPPDNLTALAENSANADFNFRSDATVNNTNFASWNDLFGPVAVHDGNFTNLYRVNISSPVDTVLTDAGIVVTGQLNRTGFTQPFAAEDIVMLTDGFCASTCSIFSELMTTQAGVQSIAVGGRPQHGPMQAVGGVKGSEILPFSDFLQVKELLPESFNDTRIAEFNKTSFANLTETPLLRTALAVQATQPSLNFRNNIRLNDRSNTPLQFVYEASDCRLFWTREMITDISAVWRKVADVAFKDKKALCVPGSTGAPTSVSGGGRGYTGYGNGEVAKLVGEGGKKQPAGSTGKSLSTKDSGGPSVKAGSALTVGCGLSAMVLALVM